MSCVGRGSPCGVILVELSCSELCLQRAHTQQNPIESRSLRIEKQAVRIVTLFESLRILILEQTYSVSDIPNRSI